MIQIPAFPAISQSTTLRFVFVFAAYVAQGLPVGLFFYAIPAWLAANDVSALVIGGYVGATALPWTLKFVNGFIMDRFTFLAMGKRRAWLASAQSIMVAGLLIGAAFNMQISDIALLTAISFSINVATTFQDVAVDGLAVDLVPENERPRANGLMFGGQAVGISLGVTLSGFLIASFGLTAAFLSIGFLVSLTLLLVLASRERPGERLLPWTSGQASELSQSQKVEAWLPLFRSVWGAMLNRNSLLLLVTFVMSGIIFGLYLSVAPLIATGPGGWSDEEFSALTGMASLLAGVSGMVVFGLLVDRIGTRLGGTLGLLIYGSMGLAMLLAEPLWIQPHIIIAFACGMFLTDVFLKVSTCSTAMRLCDARVAATQFTLYMASANLGITISGFMTGPLDAWGGHSGLLTGIILAGWIGATAFVLIKSPKPVATTLTPAVD